MNTVNYQERKTFVKYDDRHYLLYLNEQNVTFAPEPESDEVQGFSYTGDHPDGGTIIEAVDVNDDNRRDKFISGLIRTRYTQDQVESIILNNMNPEKRETELVALQSFRVECKNKIDALLMRL